MCLLSIPPHLSVVSAFFLWAYPLPYCYIDQLSVLTLSSLYPYLGVLLSITFLWDTYPSSPYSPLLLILYLPLPKLRSILRLDPPTVPVQHTNEVPAPSTINVIPPSTEPASSPRKRPVRVPGLVGTSAAFIVPDFIRRKFAERWTSHVPLTYLTDKGCLLKNKNAAQDILAFDPVTGQVTTTPKVLNDNGELSLTFDEWHQAWRRLLELIGTYIPEELLAWEIHYNFILNNENRAEMWPLYLSYDAEIRRRSTFSSIDPSQFSIGIWNDLEARYTANKVLSMVQSDLKQISDRLPGGHSSSHTPRIPNPPPSFRNHQSLPDNPRVGRCIFCGDRSKDHPPRLCTASCYANGSPCHLARQGPSGRRTSKSGKRYCYSWNGPMGCDQNPCPKGEHICTLCGISSHNAQRCDVVV